MIKMKLFKQKKGIFYTIMGIIMLILIVQLLTPRTQITLGDQELTVSFQRIRSMNLLVQTIKLHVVPDLVKISFYKSLQLMNKKINCTNEPYHDVSSIIKDVNSSIVKGIILKTQGCGPYHNPYNMTSMFSNLTYLANESVLNLTHLFLNITDVFQNASTGNYNIGLNYTLKFDLLSEDSYWNVTQNSSVIISLLNLYDPLDILNKGTIPYQKKIIYSTTQVAYYGLALSDGTLYMQCENNWKYVDCFINQMNFSRYDYNSKSPDYIARLLNDTSNESNCCGLESLVNPIMYYNKKSGGCPPEDRSFLDKCLIDPSLKGCGGQLYDISSQKPCSKIYNIISSGTNDHCTTFLLNKTEAEKYGRIDCIHVSNPVN